MWKVCACLVVSTVLAVAGCGKGDKGGGGGGGASIETEMTEHPFGMVVVKGKLPKWPEGGMGELQLKEKVEKVDMVVAAIGFDSFGGTGVDEAKMKAHIEEQKKQTLGMTISGAKPELVEDVAEVKPGVLAYVTKAKDFLGDGHEFTVNVWHLPKDGDVMYGCRGRSRLTKANAWKTLKSICAEVEFVPKK